MAKKCLGVVVSSSCLVLFLALMISVSVVESASKRRSGKRKHLDDYDPDQNDLIPIPDHYLDDNDDISYDDEEELDEINDGKPNRGTSKKTKILEPIIFLLGGRDRERTDERQAGRQAGRQKMKSANFGLSKFLMR